MKRLLVCGLFICYGLSYSQVPKIGQCAVFPADNVWNTSIENLPVDANSSLYVATIGRGGLKADFGQGLWDGGRIGIPFITVPGTQPKYRATFYYPDESDPGPYAVPLNAPIEDGSDHHAISVDTDNCILYEMYDAAPEGGKWSAGSGAIYDLKSHSLRPSGWTSADAAGLPMLPGMVRYDEIVQGEIRHAIRFTAPQTRNSFIWPARHQASRLTSVKYPPMGQRFRLTAGFDISGFSQTNQVILRALKKYGMILADNGSPWYITGVPDERWDNDDLHRLVEQVSGSNFEAIDESSLMIDPDSGQARQSSVIVTLSPASVKIPANGSLDFSASVSGNADQAVTWLVNGVVGGNSAVGWVSAIGTYQTPTAPPYPTSVRVQARSVADPTAVGSATVTIVPPPAITSLTPSPVRVGNFTLTVNGSGFQKGALVNFDGSNLATHHVSATRLRATGVAMAVNPAVAVSVTNPDSVASNTVTIAVIDRAVTVNVTPAATSVKAGRTRQFVATVRNASDKTVIWKVNGIVGGDATVGTLSASGLYTAPAAPGTFWVTATSVADPTKFDKSSVAVKRAK